MDDDIPTFCNEDGFLDLHMIFLNESIENLDEAIETITDIIDEHKNHDFNREYMKLLLHALRETEFLHNKLVDEYKRIMDNL
ncbi:MAG: hypothetical protein VYE59_02775 [Candidatus Thermoplasmatota archaeon]|nr:hypothetical protein [Candidatus Thermoplasmatota archaeon]MED5485521.1 hypothetical protein [Candidatus Thermoplasmatota archaeon]MEE3135048.1 hypothetical protein [Candidatus Thermoplasmatota archaeon]|tara:strand:- start:7989 stop:8234 length:246 start_codon:yes stop_codon:yes gene_type:complete